MVVIHQISTVNFTNSKDNLYLAYKEVYIHALCRGPRIAEIGAT